MTTIITTTTVNIRRENFVSRQHKRRILFWKKITMVVELNVFFPYPNRNVKVQVWWNKIKKKILHNTHNCSGIKEFLWGQILCHWFLDDKRPGTRTWYLLLCTVDRFHIYIIYVKEILIQMRIQKKNEDIFLNEIPAICVHLDYIIIIIPDSG